MSDRKRAREKEDRRDHKRDKISKDDLEKLKTHTKKVSQEVQKLKHIETFYEKPPPGFIKEHEEKPEDCIPAEPGNEEARSFLAHAPTRGLWMPLGKEVKVMQYVSPLIRKASSVTKRWRDPGWRCKRYGHRTGDRECPFFITGNQKLEHFRVAHEDPMYDLIRENKRNEKETRIQQLQQLLQDTTSSSSSESDSSSSSSSSSSDHHRRKKRKKKDKKKKDKKKRKRKHKHKSKTNDCSDSD